MRRGGWSEGEARLRTRPTGAMVAGDYRIRTDARSRQDGMEWQEDNLLYINILSENMQ